jgi:quercetin 2,3-dioxygenase
LERQILKILKSHQTLEGAGVKLKRVLGNDKGSTLDPFLLLDHFGSDNPEDYIKGIPWHPHRGMETVTYMWTGEVEHGDSMGNKGVIKSGDVQWMTAGSGIIHQEMPINYKGLMQGFQLWVNLPAKKKMVDPKYRGILKEHIPRVQKDGINIKIIAGKTDEIQGPVRDLAIDIEYFDVELDSGKTFEHKTAKKDTVFAYVVEGSVEVQGKTIPKGQCLVFGEGNFVRIGTKNGSRFIYVSGEPLNEPVAWRGPIVMNTEEELETAFKELENGSFIKTESSLDAKQKIGVV